MIEYGDDATPSPIVGSVYHDNGRLPVEANARLIAAAPELLEQLRLLVRWAEDRAEADGEINPCQYAKAAIAKATQTA